MIIQPGDRVTIVAPDGSTVEGSIVSANWYRPTQAMIFGGPLSGDPIEDKVVQTGPVEVTYSVLVYETDPER